MTQHPLNDFSIRREEVGQEIGEKTLTKITRRQEFGRSGRSERAATVFSHPEVVEEFGIETPAAAISALWFEWRLKFAGFQADKGKQLSITGRSRFDQAPFSDTTRRLRPTPRTS